MTGVLRPFAVVKIGGSLVSDAPRLRALLAELAGGGAGPAVIVPGGGPFADAVRTAQRALGFGEPLAHRLALDAMACMAEAFSELEPCLRIACTAHDASDALTQGRTVIWDAAELRRGHCEISESWDVTSDSLALWLATRLSVKRCVLAKSASCPTGATPGDLVRLGLVDRAFPRFARVFPGEVVVRTPVEDVPIARDPECTASEPTARPEMRGPAVSRRSPRRDAAASGGLLRGRIGLGDGLPS